MIDYKKYALHIRRVTRGYGFDVSDDEITARITEILQEFSKEAGLCDARDDASQHVSQ